MDEMTCQIRVMIERITGRIPENQEGLLDNGILDSLTMMDLIIQIEKEFAIHIPNDELTHYNFDSVKNIVAMIERLRSKTE